MIYDKNLRQDAEQIIGKCYKGPLKRLFLATKSGNQAFSRKNVSISLLRLIFSRINCQTLEDIILYNVLIGDQVVDVLLEFQFNSLKSIDLRESIIGEVGVKKLVQKRWPALKYLRLNQNNIRDEGLKIILNSHLFHQLTFLNLAQNNITWIGLKVFPTQNFNNLQKLQLYNNYLGQKGAQYLAKSDLPQLTYLNLMDSGITNQSIRHLCKAQWPNFQRLQICSNVGINTQCMIYFEGVSWKLKKLITSFKNKICLHYFSSVVWLSEQQELKIRIKDVDVEEINAFMNANIMLSRFVLYD